MYHHSRSNSGPNVIKRNDEKLRSPKTPKKEKRSDPNVMKRNEEKLRSPKEPKKEKRNVIKEYLMDYAANSNLHGLRYIGEKERTPVEKIFWLFMFICCVVLSAVQIRNIWIKWNDSPVIVSFDENTIPIYEIPLPAVTVCLDNKSLQTKFNYTGYFKTRAINRTMTFLNATHEDRKFEDVSLVCNRNFIMKNGRKFSDGNETVENIKSIFPKMTEVLSICTLKNENEGRDCESLFASVLTEEGLCYTFNMLDADELFRTENLHKDYQYVEKGLSRQNLTKFWDLDVGYLPESTFETFPHRTTLYGANYGFDFTMQTKVIDMDYLCAYFQSFKILLHQPAEMPKMSQHYFRAPLSQEISIAVNPRIMTTSNGLRPYSPERRQCYFPSERYLKYFKIYTQTNCEIECLTNFTYAMCDCVHFSMPHGPDMEVCNTGSIPCMKKAQSHLPIAVIGAESEQEIAKELFGRALPVASHCKCLAGCISIEYEAETSQADFDWKAIYTEKKDFSKMASVNIFFKKPQLIITLRSELYGQTDFLASCGGLLGLFMGFSILSVAEIAYFLTLRLVCVIWRRRNNKRLEDKNSNDPRSP